MMEDVPVREGEARSTVVGDLLPGLSKHIRSASKPISPDLHLVSGAKGARLFIPNASQTIPLSDAMEKEVRTVLELGDRKELAALLYRLGASSTTAIDDTPLSDPPLHALSLAIAQKCNLGCMYCYADQGDFGGAAKSMPLETALKSIDLLLSERKAGDRVQLTFLGGEPLMNRKAIFQATEYAWQQAKEKGVDIGFSITTNGTLVRPADADFFEQYGFAVTVSIDGPGQVHDELRPMKNGKGSFGLVMKRIAPLLERQQKMQVSARVTVTPANMNLPETLDFLIDQGFHSVGFSPLLNSINGQGEMTSADLKVLLEGMVACGLKFEQQVMQGKRYPFLNMVNALKEIGKRTHRPYPCGAGAGYMGVSADGDLAACHRFVNEPAGAMGNIETGIDQEQQNTWLADRHVHHQDPCHQCWARYLCGGGCHHEVIEKGRVACDYIRGWLYYTLQAHDRLSRYAPVWMH